MARILVIEDHDVNLRLATIILESAGHEVLCACDATSGLEAVRTKSPDVVLMDIQLPGVDGMTVTQDLKADPATAAVPIVAVTAFAMKGDKERFLAAGFDGYLAKPYQTGDLLKAIALALAPRGVLSANRRLDAETS
jgi:two-component system, cell cycle response regulator DivK